MCAMLTLCTANAETVAQLQHRTVEGKLLPTVELILANAWRLRHGLHNFAMHAAYKASNYLPPCCKFAVKQPCSDIVQYLPVI